MSLNPTIMITKNSLELQSKTEKQQKIGPQSNDLNRFLLLSHLDKCGKLPFTQGKKKISSEQAILKESLKMLDRKFHHNYSKQRVPFSVDEDNKLKKLVEKYGKQNWNSISSFMSNRTAKQCRDRYCNYLNPGIFHGEWANEEDELLIKLFNEKGPKWSCIQKFFPYRSTNSIKNRWQFFLCRQNRTFNQPRQKISFGNVIDKESKFIEKENKMAEDMDFDFIDNYENEWLAFD
ncbi:hypothetical protein M9Y10_021302 [Tritrichomonas musculus]|uniref:Myb-like DNA-binding domain containing protein n=1 Tax=Tritrichomonas musculus TaxID=1915356 RepID=A0ABR2HEG7_9EUKA